jgi:hypothetical protein
VNCGTSLFGKSSEIESFRTVPGSLWKIGTLPISRQLALLTTCGCSASHTIFESSHRLGTKVESTSNERVEALPWNNIARALVRFPIREKSEERKNGGSGSGGTRIITASDLQALHF